MAYEKKLIEGNFPCQQVGAETKRERGASSALPPLYFLHVWWARRPLTPSRAAVLGSILPADVQPDVFLKDLGIVKKQAIIGDARWTLVGKNLELIEAGDRGEYIPYSAKFRKAFDKENERRAAMRKKLNALAASHPEVAADSVFVAWKRDNQEMFVPLDLENASFRVETYAADPAAINDRIAFASSDTVSNVLEGMIRLDDEDRYGYDRAFVSSPFNTNHSDICVLDPTAGGGSIPFEAERLGCRVISNDLNPVATAIQYATLDYPVRYGQALLPDLEVWGTKMVQTVREKVGMFFPDPDDSVNDGFLYCREVTCPHCGERAPLLNAFALSKKKDGWMVLPKIEGFAGSKTVHFIPTRLKNGKGPNGEDPEKGTVHLGTGTCIHCGQAIESEEIKRQARGESAHGTWADRLYCVVGVREQPKLDKDSAPMTYASGLYKGRVRTEKVTFFREPTERDLEALEKAEAALKANWDRWEAMDLIPTERIPEMNDNRPKMYGSERWCDMFTPRQLLGLLTAMETLHDMMPEIMAKHGPERGKAIVHYLQYMIDKCVDYNSRQTRWHYSRGVAVGTFGRHDFSLKWSFCELIFTGPSTGLKWGMDQIIDAYKGTCGLISGQHTQLPTILNGSAASMNIPDKSVDIICVDPPYYNNVQYAELSDFFYVWQKRTFRDLYPDFFGRRLTNKADEAVANPVRDGSAANADRTYERLMSEIFSECRRVMKDDGVLTMMFTHKTQEAWETLTRALIENGWIISSSFPVDSESGTSIHQKDMAAAASSIFLACRKRDLEDRAPAVWNGFGGTGVMQQIREAVRQSLKDYEVLHLNSVDEMVASYGSALKVLSENWPVMDGDEPVSPIRAMREASTVVAQYQMTKLTGGRLSVDDVSAEAAIALTLFGINGTGYFAFDDALSLSKSLNIRLEHKAAGYRDEGRMIGINDERTGRTRATGEDEEGYYAPVVKKGSKLRLVMPEERNPKRLAAPQSEWDIMQGVIMAYREGDIPVARAYLQRQAEGKEDKVIGLMRVWADGCGEELRKEAQRILFGLKG